MATPESIFKELEDRFAYEAPITELILSKGLTTLAEFSHYCTDTADVVATFITPIATKLFNERLQGASSTWPGQQLWPVKRPKRLQM